MPSHRRLANFIVAIALASCLSRGLTESIAQARQTKPQPVSIANGGFESKLEHWTLHIYGAPAAAEFDAQVKHGGEHSLRVSSRDLSDAALGQEIELIPNSWYRFSGWVRTAGLKPQDAKVFGTFQIQLPAGHGVLASGENHQGDTPWTEVALFFRAPADGRARIAPFFAGFGTGSGTAWFDDLSIEPVELGQTPARITSQPLHAGRISPLQYGQFIEYLCDSVGALWAEKLYDGGFEGLSPYKVEYLKQTDFREKAWYPTGATNRANFVADKADPFAGKHSQKIEATGDTPAVVGVSQDGVSVQQDVPCKFSCYLRQEGIVGDVEALVERDGAVIGSVKFQPTGTWKKYSASIAPARTEHNATFTIRFTGPGKLWIDSASLMPDDAIGGWRRDAVEALRAVKPGIIRFGGTALEAPSFGDFEWRHVVGDPDRRPPLRAWGGLQKTGPGLKEFVQLCHEVSAEPLICVRTFNRQPQDAADEIEYFNGAAETPLGKLRASGGHPQPYGVKYWQIGNERTDENYVSQIAPFARAMRKADPSIRLLSGFPTEAIVRQSAELCDYICPHQYDCMNLAATDAELLAARDLIHRFAPDRDIKLAITEWNSTAGDFGPLRAKLWTLENGLAVARYHNLLHRRCDLVEIANRSNLSNSFCSGAIQTDNHRLYKTPAYYAQQLYATLAGDRPLKIDSRAPAEAGPDMSATLSADGATVTLLAVNDTTAEIVRPIDFSDFGQRGQNVSVWTLADRESAGQPDCANNFANPERITAIRATREVPAARFDYRFPALSLTVLQWKVEK